jgi:hypothetical protein
VLFVLKAIFTLVCLNRFVMYVVFWLVYVKVFQFWFCVKVRGGGGCVFLSVCGVHFGVSNNL